MHITNFPFIENIRNPFYDTPCSCKQRYLTASHLDAKKHELFRIKNINLSNIDTQMLKGKERAQSDG